ncbi:hypothetical protein [Romboutsia ilealis]|uniref:hypothetical protein n=1 Tax=Romboutsia ilealis TaxID=1115758 RepID=UPI0025B788EB|nr:hypothetical protein [Romboutsia ilealis]
MSVKKILKYFAHAVAQATDEVVGDIKISAHTWLKRIEFFIYDNSSKNKINNYILDKNEKNIC